MISNAFTVTAISPVIEFCPFRNRSFKLALCLEIGGLLCVISVGARDVGQRSGVRITPASVGQCARSVGASWIQFPHLLDRILDQSCQRRVVLRRVHHDPTVSPNRRWACSSLPHCAIRGDKSPRRTTNTVEENRVCSVFSRSPLNGTANIAPGGRSHDQFLSAILDSGHRFGVPCASLFSVRLQFLTRGSVVTLEISCTWSPPARRSGRSTTPGSVCSDHDLARVLFFGFTCFNTFKASRIAATAFS